MNTKLTAATWIRERERNSNVFYNLGGVTGEVAAARCVCLNQHRNCHQTRDPSRPAQYYCQQQAIKPLPLKPHRRKTAATYKLGVKKQQQQRQKVIQWPLKIIGDFHPTVLSLMTSQSYD